MGNRLNRNAHLARNRARLANLERRIENEQLIASELPSNDWSSLFAIVAFFVIFAYLIWRA